MGKLHDRIAEISAANSRFEESGGARGRAYDALIETLDAVERMLEGGGLVALDEGDYAAEAWLDRNRNALRGAQGLAGRDHDLPIEPLPWVGAE